MTQDKATDHDQLSSEEKSEKQSAQKARSHELAAAEAANKDALDILRNTGSEEPDIEHGEAKAEKDTAEVLKELLQDQPNCRSLDMRYLDTHSLLQTYRAIEDVNVRGAVNAGALNAANKQLRTNAWQASQFRGMSNLQLRTNRELAEWAQRMSTELLPTITNKAVIADMVLGFLNHSQESEGEPVDVEPYIEHLSPENRQYICAELMNYAPGITESAKKFIQDSMPLLDLDQMAVEIFGNRSSIFSFDNLLQSFKENLDPFYSFLTIDLDGRHIWRFLDAVAESGIGIDFVKSKFSELRSDAVEYFVVKAGRFGHDIIDPSSSRSEGEAIRIAQDMARGSTLNGWYSNNNKDPLVQQSSLEDIQKAFEEAAQNQFSKPLENLSLIEMDTLLDTGKQRWAKDRKNLVFNELEKILDEKTQQLPMTMRLLSYTPSMDTANRCAAGLAEELFSTPVEEITDEQFGELLVDKIAIQEWLKKDYWERLTVNMPDDIEVAKSTIEVEFTAIEADMNGLMQAAIDQARTQHEQYVSALPLDNASFQAQADSLLEVVISGIEKKYGAIITEIEADTEAQKNKAEELIRKAFDSLSTDVASGEVECQEGEHGNVYILNHRGTYIAHDRYSDGSEIVEGAIDAGLEKSSTFQQAYMAMI